MNALSDSRVITKKAPMINDTSDVQMFSTMLAQEKPGDVVWEGREVTDDKYV